MQTQTFVSDYGRHVCLFPYTLPPLLFPPAPEYTTSHKCASRRSQSQSLGTRSQTSAAAAADSSWAWRIIKYPSPCIQDVAPHLTLSLSLLFTDLHWNHPGGRQPLQGASNIRLGESVRCFLGLVYERRTNYTTLSLLSTEACVVPYGENEGTGGVPGTYWGEP